MNELFLFHWLSWLLIIIVFFFVSLPKAKQFFLYTLFLIMLSVHLDVYFFNEIETSVAFIILMIAAFIYYAQLQFSFYDIIVTLIVIISYVALLLWENVSPIWFVMNPLLMISLIVCSLVMMLTQSLAKRISIVMLGLPIGQLLFTFILMSYGLYERLGGFTFFITLFSHIILLLLVGVVEMLRRRLKINITY